jgi:NodT family efflux transporter outer membrane factor (OMF) lipoprotein
MSGSSRQLAPRLVLLLAVALMFPGCKGTGWWLHNGFRVGPNHAEPSAPIAAEWLNEKHPAVSLVAQDDFAWWTVFQDPTLTSLVDMARRQNLELSAAAARIMEARARRNIAAGNLFPQNQQLVAGYARAQISQNLQLPIPLTTDIWFDGLNASWELDFWGRLRRMVESGDAQIDAAVEDYGDSLVMLVAEVATTYVRLRTFEQRLLYAQENVRIQSDSLDLVQARFEQGLVTELDLRQARASLAQTRASIPPLAAGRQMASNQLCILLGMPVHDLASQMPATTIPTAPPQVAIGIPADLLRRRPDVRRAERLAAAQSAQIGVAQADFYPRIAVNGFIGYAANDFRGLFDASSLTGAIVPTLQWQVLNYGRIANNVRAQEARYEASIRDYQQTVLRAGREVEDALVQFVQAKRQATFLLDSVTDSRRAVEIAQEQFRGGIADFNRVYTNQSLLVEQQDQFATVEGNIALYVIQVYRALGGGWQYFCQGGDFALGAPGLPAAEALPAVDPAP